ncbi:LrgB family protein [Kordiimonas sp. SCSIO 12603]|uniref:LrgB family protein n=1 Tax=Kordiimonas sp. SCSIO 12603 TaxID=2829596 RepID=UPI0021068453|nr:LrgB family protein [Kordiimonas sp. SCSIO 12603]UTW60099.1 LrgB family protein [Kordiimonas sp. SCSIO 12603]
MTEFFWFLSVCGLYGLADILYRRSGRKHFLHPVMLPTILLVSVLHFTSLEYAVFERATYVFDVLLMAAVAALSVPLYRNFSAIRRNPVAILSALVGGSVAGSGSAVVVALWAKASPDVVTSLYVKSITTPMAVAVVEPLGGIPAISAVVVILTGLIVALIGPSVLRMVGVDHQVAQGIAMGTAGHALGMAESIRHSDLMGAAAAFAMATNGLLTALLLPLLLG